MPNINCDRCYIREKLQKHHKKHKADGGSDKTPNRQWLCEDCHDYKHAIDATRKVIKIEEERLKVLYKRLEIIEMENTPLLIRERGYRSYWDIYKKFIPTFGDKWPCSDTTVFIPTPDAKIVKEK